MAIGSAIKARIADLRVRRTRNYAVPKVRGSGLNDGLLGFTGSTVTVRFGSIIYTYDEDGQTIYAKSA